MRYQKDMKIVVGDINAKVGRNSEDMEDIMGKEVLGENAN